MQKRIAVVMTLALLGAGIPALALDQMEVTYVNGTVKAVQENATGTLDTSSESSLQLRAGTSNVAIPYGAVTAYEYHEENRFRLGVLPAIAVGIVKARSKRHLVTIAWKDGGGVAQTATFDTTRDRARGLVKVLDVRAPQAKTPGQPWRKNR